MEFGTEEVPVMAVYGPVKVKNEETGEEETLTRIVNTAKFKDSLDVDGTILTEVKQGKDGAGIKLADRMKALQWLADHMNLATEEQRAKIEKDTGGHPKDAAGTRSGKKNTKAFRQQWLLRYLPRCFLI